MLSHARVLKSKSKKNPFRVKIIGENSETLVTSECLKSRFNCYKNIVACLNAFDGQKILVRDFTDKKSLPCKTFYLHNDFFQEAVS